MTALSLSFIKQKQDYNLFLVYLLSINIGLYIGLYI